MSQQPAKFKLLDLPSVAIEHVIRAMDLESMFFFSLASRKAKSILNFSLPKSYLRVEYVFRILEVFALKSPNQTLFFGPPTAYCSEDPKSCWIQGILYQIYNFDGPIQMNWDETFEAGMQTLITHIAESFHLPKTFFNVENLIDSEAAFTFLNHVKSLNAPLMEVQMRMSDLPIEVYKAFLDVGPRIIQKLHLESRSAPDFQFRSSEVFKLDELDIGDGHWVHLEDFMECKHVVVRNLTAHPNMYYADSKKLNGFFKLWKASRCRLEHVEIDVRFNRDLSFDETTAELDGTNFIRTDDDQSGEIQRVDGRKATILMTPMYLTLKVFD